MRCTGCGTESLPGAMFCEKCGAVLLDLGTGMPDLGGELAKLQSDLAEQIRASSAPFASGLAGIGSPLDFGAPTSSATPPSAPRRSLIHAREWEGLLIPPPEQINQSATFAFSSPHVQANPLYRARVAEITFEFLPDDPELNAFATDHPLTLADGRAIEPPAIVFLGGLAVAIRLTSAALAAHIRNARAGQETWNLSKMFQELGRAILRSGGELSVDTAVEVFQQAVAPALPEEERFVSLARSYAAAMETFAVAHEAGHIALGHTLGTALNYDISCNQEREADSFASSTLSSSPFREYLFLGQVFVTILFAWVEHTAQRRTATTHPLAVERFKSAIQSNRQAAQEAATDFGLTQERLGELLPGRMGF